MAADMESSVISAMERNDCSKLVSLRDDIRKVVEKHTYLTNEHISQMLDHS